MEAAATVAAVERTPEQQELVRQLRRVERRLRLQEASRRFPTAAALALAAGIATAVAGRLRPGPGAVQTLAVTAGYVLAALLVTFLWVMLRRRDLMATALRADLLLTLDERLSTALEDSARPVAGQSAEQRTLFEAQLADALKAARRISPSRDFPLLPARRSLAAPALLAAAFVLALFLPIPSGLFSQSEPAVKAQVEVERGQLEELKKQAAAGEHAADPARQALLMELDQLLADLANESLTREETLARLSETESRLEKSLDPQAAAQREALDELARQLAASGNEQARQAAEALQRGDGKGAEDALKSLAGDEPALTPEERQRLAESLQAARDRTAALDPEMARKLNDAAEALKTGNSEAARQALNDLADNTRASSDRQATQQEIEKALAQVQQSKSNIAQAGMNSPSASVSGTVVAAGSPVALGGSPVAASGTPLAGAGGTPLAGGTPVALAGTPRSGQLAGTGTPVVVLGTPGTGTPVAVQGGQQQGSSGAVGGQNVPTDSWGRGHSDLVYTPPTAVTAASTRVALQGQDNPTGEQATGQANADVNTVGPSQVPYQQVYGQYSQQAGDALRGDYIPQGYKDLVRDYFTSIEP